MRYWRVKSTNLQILDMKYLYLFLLIINLHSRISTTRELNENQQNNMCNVNEARESLQELINLVHHRFEMGNRQLFQFFQISSNIDKNSWDIIKYKFALKMLMDRSRFLMIFGGSSVTAGHDNFFNQSYPDIFKKRMIHSFHKLNIKLVVRNIAHAHNQCLPSELCYYAMGGDNADWIGWEQSFNCGRDGGMHELIARIAGWEKAVIYYSASGGFTPSECLPSTVSVPWRLCNIQRLSCDFPMFIM